MNNNLYFYSFCFLELEGKEQFRKSSKHNNHLHLVLKQFYNFHIRRKIGKHLLAFLLLLYVHILDKLLLILILCSFYFSFALIIEYPVELTAFSISSTVVFELSNSISVFPFLYEDSTFIIPSI